MPNPLGDSPAAEANPLGDSVVDAGGVAVEENPLGDAPAKGEGGLPPGMSREDAAFLKDLGRSGFRTEGSFQEKILEPAARGALEPSIKLPDVGEVPDISIPLPVGRLSLSNAAGIYEGLKAIPEALTAPIGSVLVPLGLAESVTPIATAIGKAAQVYFAGDLAKAGGAEAADAWAVLNDPKSTMRQKIASVTKAAGTLGLSAMVGTHAAKGISRLGEQPVKIDVRQPDGTTAQVELPASEAAKQVNDHVTNVVNEAGKDLDSIYQQAGVERVPPPIEMVDAPGKMVDASGRNPLGDEPFVEATAQAVKPIEAPPHEVQYTIFPPEAHPMTGEEIPSFVQIETKTNEGRGEPLTAEQKAQFPTEEQALASGLPKGQYTLAEVQKAIDAKSDEHITATKNAQVDAEREAHGIEAADEAVVRDFPEVREAAEKIIQDDPLASQKLVQGLRENPRALTDVENAVLLHRQVLLQNEFRDTPIGDTETIQRLSDELTDLYNAGKEAGTETGRGLNARKMAVAEDFSLANLITLRRAQKGERLTEQELAETAALHKEISDLQKENDTLRTAREAPTRLKRIVEALKPGYEAALERQRAKAGRLSAGIDPTDLKDYAQIGAYHLARGIEKVAEWSAEMVKDLGEKITPHLAAIRQEAEKLHAESLAASADESKLKAYKTRTFKRALEVENKANIGDFEKQPRRAIPKDAEALRLQAKLEQAKSKFAALLERDRFEKLSLLGKAREMAVNTYDAARNIMTTGEFSFILRQGKFAALSHPILTSKTVPSAFRALFTDEVGARAIDLETFNQPEIPAARAAKLHLVEEGAKLSRQEEIFASKWAENIPLVRNFNQAGRVFLNKLRFDVWKTLRESVDATTPAQDAVLAKFVNEATGRGTLGGAEPAAVALGRAFFSPRYLASRVQLLVGHSMWGGDFTTRRIIAKEYAKALVGLGLYYTLLAQMKDKNGKPATIEKDPRSSDFGKVKIGNTRLDPLAGLAQVIVFGSRTATLERKDAKGKIQSLQSGKFGAPKWSDVAANFARSKLHPVPGAVINVFNGTDLGGNPATIQNQAMNMAMPLTYADIYQALEEQDLPEGVALSLLTMLGDGLQTYDTNRKRPKPPAKK